MPSTSPARTSNETSCEAAGEREPGRPPAPPAGRSAAAARYRRCSSLRAPRGPCRSSPRSGRPCWSRPPAPRRPSCRCGTPSRVSETRRMSSMKCEMKTMAVPSSRSRRKVANRRSTSGGESAEVGSSRMMMRAPENSTRAISISCCRPIGRSPSRASGSTSMPNLASCSPRFARHAPPLHEAEAIGRLRAEKDVLGHRQIGRDAELLMDHGDAGRARVARRAEAGLPAVEHEAAREFRMHAGDDLHQRALAGAVLADETMDLAGGEREVDPAQRLDAAEGLRDLRAVRGGASGPAA